MDRPEIALPLADIEQSYPHQWVLVEETAWDDHGHPLASIVCIASAQRDTLREPLHRCHQHPRVKTFIFYTGDKSPINLTALL